MPNLGLMNRASRADLLGKALEGSTTDMSQLLSRGHVVVSQGDAHTNSSSALKNLKEIKINTNTMSYYEQPATKAAHYITPRHYILFMYSLYHPRPRTYERSRPRPLLYHNRHHSSQGSPHNNNN